MPSNVFHNNPANDAIYLVSNSYIFRQVPPSDKSSVDIIQQSFCRILAFNYLTTLPFPVNIVQKQSRRRPE